MILVLKHFRYVALDVRWTLTLPVVYSFALPAGPAGTFDLNHAEFVSSSRLNALMQELGQIDKPLYK
jgi:hypothetical protein